MADAFSMVAAVVAGLFIGVKLDQYIQTTPLFTVLLTFAGIGVSIYNVLRKGSK